MIKSKMSNLAKINTSDFTKENPFGMDFLTLKDKKIFIHLYKSFIKVTIPGHFDLGHYI